jgi:hypothetical protein
MQCSKGTKLFRDKQGRVVRQHDAAGADADRARTGGDMGERHRGRGARYSRQVVMFGHPEALVAERLDAPRQFEGIP